MGEAGVAFRELLTHRPGEMPGDAQRRASRELPGRVVESRMNWWKLGDPISPAGRRLLLGVSIWSGYDLRLLDLVDGALTDPPPGLVVDVFDMDAAREPDWFEPYIPRIGDVCITPVAGLWQNGRLVRCGAGHEARRIAAELFGFDLASLATFPPLTAVP